MQMDNVKNETVSIIKFMNGKELSLEEENLHKATIPQIVADNHFSGENVINFIARKGFCITTTCQRDWIPPGLHLNNQSWQ